MPYTTEQDYPSAPHLHRCPNLTGSGNIHHSRLQRHPMARHAPRQLHRHPHPRLHPFSSATHLRHPLTPKWILWTLESIPHLVAVIPTPKTRLMKRITVAKLTETLRLDIRTDDQPKLQTPHGTQINQGMEMFV